MATEKRLIRYDGLKQEIIDFKKGLNPKNTDYATGYFSALSVVEGMMVQHIATDAVEVVHGHNLRDHDSAFECSVCGWEDWDTLTADTSQYNYCPNCGAKMDVDGNGT